jgi:beta-lactamase regulating signal transducer with metallopeptidase domain
MTMGVLRPVIVLPVTALDWSPDARRTTLMHELVHVGSGDALFLLASRLMCALFWFHPGAWWVSRRFEAEAELACDDRVLLAGVRPSDYTELLVRALAGRDAPGAGAIALVGQRGVRHRLAAITDTRRALRLPSRRCVAAAVLVTGLVSLPLGTVRVAPTRDVLTALMRDDRWESRAYAVVRLAQRTDSLEVARVAARHDPSPRVRAWAQYALARRPVTRPDLAPLSLN